MDLYAWIIITPVCVVVAWLQGTSCGVTSTRQVLLHDPTTHAHGLRREPRHHGGSVPYGLNTYSGFLSIW